MKKYEMEKIFHGITHKYVVENAFTDTRLSRVYYLLSGLTVDSGGEIVHKFNLSAGLTFE